MGVLDWGASAHLAIPWPISPSARCPGSPIRMNMAVSAASTSKVSAFLSATPMSSATSRAAERLEEQRPHAIPHGLRAVSLCGDFRGHRGPSSIRQCGGRERRGSWRALDGLRSPGRPDTLLWRRLTTRLSMTREQQAVEGLRRPRHVALISWRPTAARSSNTSPGGPSLKALTPSSTAAVPSLSRNSLDTDVRDRFPAAGGPRPRRTPRRGDADRHRSSSETQRFHPRDDPSAF